MNLSEIIGKNRVNNWHRLRLCIVLCPYFFKNQSLSLRGDTCIQMQTINTGAFFCLLHSIRPATYIKAAHKSQFKSSSANHLQIQNACNKTNEKTC